MIHFSHNATAQDGDRLAKILPLIDILESNFKNMFCPEKDIVIDETLIPWRGRLIFRQYIPNKAHRYGIKMFKLCSVDGYTWDFRIYASKSATGQREIGLAQKVCLELAKDLLNEGRTLYVDNFYTSYKLAKSFLQKETHVVGTLRANKKDFPKEVLKAKHRRGEMIAKEDQDGIVVLKWREHEMFEFSQPSMHPLWHQYVQCTHINLHPHNRLHLQRLLPSSHLHLHSQAQPHSHLHIHNHLQVTACKHHQLTILQVLDNKDVEEQQKSP